MAPAPVERPEADTSGFRVIQEPAPPPPPSTDDEHPPLIALKNRWAYTAVKYWVTGKTFHFITTQGDHMQVPTALVERVYPTLNQSHRAEPKRESKN